MNRTSSHASIAPGAVREAIVALCVVTVCALLFIAGVFTPSHHAATATSTDTSTTQAEQNDVDTTLHLSEVPEGDELWAAFDDSVIMGDSRAYGFLSNGYLDSDHVIADAGMRINTITYHEQDEALAAANPNAIYLCFGLNDISIGIWPTFDDYEPVLDEAITDLHALCPNATIYVNSILPVYDPAYEVSSAWRNIPQWNERLKSYCDENGLVFIDNTALCEEHRDLWVDDGIHLRSEFYPYWAHDMIAARIEHEQS